MTKVKKVLTTHLKISKAEVGSSQLINPLTKVSHKHHDKVETKVDGTFEEVGDCPNYKQGERTDLQFLYNQIEQGLSTSDIINENPKFMLRMTEIERVRQMLLENKYKNTFRNLDVTYIWGDSGTGKTRGIMEKIRLRKCFSCY